MLDDYGEECENCQCLACLKNDVTCFNCAKCNGCNGYSQWMMDCNKYQECKDPEKTIKTILKIVI